LYGFSVPISTVCSVTPIITATVAAGHGGGGVGMAEGADVGADVNGTHLEVFMEMLPYEQANMASPIKPIARYPLASFQFKLSHEMFEENPCAR
jgi:hypothetical protein